MCSFGISPPKLRPTRVTQQSEVSIDQIWYNDGDPSSNLSSGVILLDLSDCFPFFVQNNAHSSSEVEDDTYVDYKCSKSSGQHKIENCRSKLLECLKYVNAKVNCSEDHEATSFNCPILIREQTQIQRRTNYSHEKN